jgi:hypothetical protein
MKKQYKSLMYVVTFATAMSSIMSSSAASCKQKTAILQKVGQIYRNNLGSKKLAAGISIAAFPCISAKITYPIIEPLVEFDWMLTNEFAFSSANIWQMASITGAAISYKLFKSCHNNMVKNADDNVTEFVKSLTPEDRIKIMPNNWSEMESIKKNIFQGNQASCDKFMNILNPKIVTK